MFHLQAQYPIGSIFFQLVRLEVRGCDEKWSNLLVHVLQHSPILQILKLVVMDGGPVLNHYPKSENSYIGVNFMFGFRFRVLI